jgi:hypothetical protein
VDVCRERAAEREAVGAGLLLRDSPAQRSPRLEGGQLGDQLGPLDPRGDLDHAALGIEGENMVESPRVAQHASPANC